MGKTPRREGNGREIDKQTKTGSNNQKTKEKIQKMFKTKKALKCLDILSTLSLSPHFIGCFAQNSLLKLSLCYPCFLIVNIDSKGEKGSHWLALRIDDKTCEIFDPLGFEIFNWKSVPCQLLEFVHSHSKDKKILIGPRIQSDFSEICALYCCFYVFYRNFNSFKTISSLFSSRLSENDQRLKLLLLDVWNRLQNYKNTLSTNK